MNLLFGNIFCLIGASLRYAADGLLNKNSGKAFKLYTDYVDNTETKFIDSILGAGVIFLALVILVEL